MRLRPRPPPDQAGRHDPQVQPAQPAAGLVQPDQQAQPDQAAPEMGQPDQHAPQLNEQDAQQAPPAQGAVPPPEQQAPQMPGGAAFAGPAMNNNALDVDGIGILDVDRMIVSFTISAD